MSRRIEIVEPCEHGNYRCSEVIEWPFNTATNGNDLIPRPCPGGSRIILTELSEEMVERDPGTLRPTPPRRPTL
jgi:hypothetical protein